MKKCMLILIAFAGAMLAQPEAPPPPQGPPAAPPPPAATPRPARPLQAPLPPQPPLPPGEPHRPPLERALHLGIPGKWWHDPGMVQRLGLTSDQQKRMDDIFQQHRLKLIDLNAALQREETIMEPLVEAEQPDETRIVAQIDKVAHARAELEKANARMLLGIRRVLNPEQWKKLQSERLRQQVPVPARTSGRL